MSFLLVLLHFLPKIPAILKRGNKSHLSPICRGETQSFEQHFGREKSLQEWCDCRPVRSYSSYQTGSKTIWNPGL